MTLSSRIYSKSGGFDIALYRRLCQTKEAQCLGAAGWRGNWSNNSCEKQFGQGDEEGLLGARGAPRWKQRAFYDFLKDVTALLESRPVVRFSIWEEMEDGSRVATLGQLLEATGPGKWRAEVVSLFRHRASVK